MSESGQLTKLIGSLDMFAQYATIFLLRDVYGIRSITWYDLSVDPQKPSKNFDRRERHWDTMRKAIGEPAFSTLQTRVMGLRGEPDLFCWNDDTDKWFFAEIKFKDKVLPSQLKWFRVCKECLGESTDIRVYRLMPS